MRIVQKFGYLDSHYERPNQKWVCGRTALGDPCRIGPDGKGCCQADFECKPRRDDDRWECTRPPIAGGECETGPLPDGTCCMTIPPCTPVRSLRAKRGLWVRWATALTIGFLAVIIGFNSSALFMPGPMTDGHSSLTTCSDCHTSVAGGPFGWMHSVFTEMRPGEDSRACLTCHVAGKNAFKPHGMSDGKVAMMSKMIAARPDSKPHPMTARVQQSMFPMDRFVDDDISCATCHVEHKGRTSDLKKMPDAECQSCHTAQFASFSSGHPEFSNYPYKRRTGIIFDHNSHMGVHFPKIVAANDPSLKAPGSCADCHELAPNRRLMAIKSFEDTCSACHVKQITGADRASGPRGVPFLAIPGLDVETLRDRNAAIGEWPEDSEAELTPFMAMMLSGNVALRDDLARLGKRDLLDLSDATDADIAAVERLAWAVKSLIFDMSTKDPGLLKKRLETGAGDVPIARLNAVMPRDVLLGARRDWLPSLARELADHKAGKRVLAPAAPDANEPDVKPSEKAEPADDKSDILSGGDDKADILSGGDDQSDILSGGDDKADILSGGGDKADILSGGDDKADILSGGDNKSDILSGGDDTPAVNKVEEAPPATAPASDPDVDEESFARLGGWYRRDYAILFHPTGHEDRFLMSWLDYAGLNGRADGSGAAVFKSLTHKNAQGGCTKCHSVDAKPGGGKQVNWTPDVEGQAKQRLTAFSHAPHFGAVGAKGCLTCHQIDDKAKYQASYTQPDPAKFASNFSPLPRAVCVDCHNPKFAGETCLTCHNYHASLIETPFLKTKIPGHKP